MSQSDKLPLIDRVSVTVVDGKNTAEMSRVRRVCDRLLLASSGEDLHDDRFEPTDQPPPDSIIALAELGEEPLAYVASSISRGRLQLDTVADIDTITELTKSPSALGAANSQAADLVASLVMTTVERVNAALSVAGADHEPLILEVWGRPRRPWHDVLAERLGMIPHRTLFQMRCALPIAPEIAAPVATRPISPQVDTAQLVEVNNRAFTYHPDQSAQELEEIAAAFASDGFRPDAVRVLDADSLPDLPSDAERPMAGFCWTKIHPASGNRAAMGEIYVIAVDPAYHGHRLGLGLTASGLDWLASQDLHVGMLYVESDNVPAVRTYQRLGFDVHADYTAWRTQ